MLSDNYLGQRSLAKQKMTKKSNILNTAQGPLTIAILNNIFFKILLYLVLKFGHCSHKLKGNHFPVQAL